MSKVIHLSRDAHERAKQYCGQHGLPMSDWVASLIERATHELHGANEMAMASPEHSPRIAQRSVSQKQSRAAGAAPPRSGDASKSEEAELALMYTAPPFWAREAQAQAQANVAAADNPH